MPATTIPTELNRIVVDIYASHGQGNPIPRGTGFFVLVKDPSKPGNAFGYLVTAKHLLQDDRGQYYKDVFVKLNKIKGGTDLVKVQLSLGDKSLVFALPDPAVDLVVMPGLPDTTIYDFRAIPEEMIQSPKAFADLDVGEGSDIVFMSPLQNFGGAETIPVARFGHIALIPSRPLAWRANATQAAKPGRFFLIEGQASSDDAGAPVFLQPNPDDAIETFITQAPLFKLIGIVIGNYSDPAAPAAATPTRQNANIEAVVPSTFLYQIIFSDELRKMRSGIVEQAKK